MNGDVLRIDPHDNAIVALRDLKAGELVSFSGEETRVRNKIPAKHKFAAEYLEEGGILTMYGVTVGQAARPIRSGELLTMENIQHKTASFTQDVEFQQFGSWLEPDVTDFQYTMFDGVIREDDQVGTANYWIVIPLVFCENHDVHLMKEALLRGLGYSVASEYEAHVRDMSNLYQLGKRGEDIINLLKMDSSSSATTSKANPCFPNVDGIRFLDHGGGCGESRMDSEALCSLIAGYICHPNVAGATVLSLGCQNAQVEMLEKAVHKRNPNFQKPLYIFEQQRYSSKSTMLKEALEKTFLGLSEANKAHREPRPLSQLALGVECGASDGFSGISANPVIGQCADLVVALGGSVILAEFPELCGVEQQLIERCTSRETADKFTSLMKRYQELARATGSGFEWNPSPGNIREGLITDAMKSAGAARKGGSSPIVDVLDYTEPLRRRGLNLLCTPGNDVESTTGLVGSGANLILFSTGMGTPTGNPIVPIIKISSNTTTAEKHKDMIDFDTGPLLSGRKSVKDLGKSLLTLCGEVAGQKKITCASRAGHDDFLPWKRGISL